METSKLVWYRADHAVPKTTDLVLVVTSEVEVSVGFYSTGVWFDNRGIKCERQPNAWAMLPEVVF